jgi:hypothetical protein
VFASSPATSLGDPTLTVGLSFAPTYAKMESAEFWSDQRPALVLHNGCVVDPTPKLLVIGLSAARQLRQAGGLNPASDAIITVQPEIISRSAK